MTNNQRIEYLRDLAEDEETAPAQWRSEIRFLVAELDAARAREAKLREAAQYYMSQFGQALEANDIPYGSDQSEADSALRAVLAEGEDTRD